MVLANLHLIPVIDVLRGKVVHAHQGRRAEYAPVESNLCQGSDPHTIMAGLLKLHPGDDEQRDVLDRLARWNGDVAARSQEAALYELWVSAKWVEPGEWALQHSPVPVR